MLSEVRALSAPGGELFPRRPGRLPVPALGVQFGLHENQVPRFGLAVLQLPQRRQRTVEISFAQLQSIERKTGCDVIGIADELRSMSLLLPRLASLGSAGLREKRSIIW